MLMGMTLSFWKYSAKQQCALSCWPWLTRCPQKSLYNTKGVLSKDNLVSMNHTCNAFLVFTRQPWQKACKKTVPHRTWKVAIKIRLHNISSRAIVWQIVYNRWLCKSAVVVMWYLIYYLWKNDQWDLIILTRDINNI